MSKMKIYFILLLIISLFALVFPIAVNSFKTQNISEFPDTVSVQSESVRDETAAQTQQEDRIKVLRTDSGNVIDISFFDYTVGCVAGEMPAYFEKEALKAQAVACCTYAKRIGRQAENEADISDSPEKHQSYLDEEQLKEKWGGQYQANLKKIKECVSEVFGEYISYGGEPIIACYHALSSGKTEDSLNVWGKDIPYLKSVSAKGDRLSPDFDRSLTFSESEIGRVAEKLGAKLPKDPKQWLKVKDKTESGFVKEIAFGSKVLSGVQIRSELSLPSACFTVKYENKKFIFTVFGSGHSLGMSQYSADYMARQGKSYREILSHFYPGTEIKA